MQLHVTVSNRSTVTFTDKEDVNALRVMAEQTVRTLEDEMRGQCASNPTRSRAYQLALWLLDRVPEND